MLKRYLERVRSSALYGLGYLEPEFEPEGHLAFTAPTPVQPDELLLVMRAFKEKPDLGLSHLMRQWLAYRWVLHHDPPPHGGTMLEHEPAAPGHDEDTTLQGIGSELCPSLKWRRCWPSNEELRAVEYVLAIWIYRQLEQVTSPLQVVASLADALEIQPQEAKGIIDAATPALRYYSALDKDLAKLQIEALLLKVATNESASAAVKLQAIKTLATVRGVNEEEKGSRGGDPLQLLIEAQESAAAAEADRPMPTIDIAPSHAPRTIDVSKKGLIF